MNVTCWGWFGDEAEHELDPEAGVTEEAEWVFSNGQCHALALGLHALTGWELGGLAWSYDDVHAPDHVVVRDNDGNLWDIGGPNADRRWQGGVYDFEPVAREYVTEHLPGLGYLEPDVEAGRVFAELVLREHNTLWAKEES